MIPEWRAYFEVLGALSVLAGVFGWQRKGSQAEDDMVAEAASVVLDAVSDADATRTVDCRTGRNWRDDVTLGECVEMGRERDLRAWPGRN